MTTDRVSSLESLLVEAEKAHGEYETTELDGARDEEWAWWYASYAIDHGIGSILTHEVSVEALAGFLASSWNELEAQTPANTEPWAAYAARRIVDEL